jgi:hypothetical protein
MKGILKTVGTCFLLSGLSVVLAGADSFDPPKQSVTYSDGQELKFSVFPPEMTNYQSFQHLNSGSYSTIPFLEANLRSKRVDCEGMLERRLKDGSYAIVWKRPLVNPVAPAASFVTQSTNGIFVITFDDWAKIGVSSNAVVIYNKYGSLVRALRLSDLMASEEISRLPKTMSSVLWLASQTVDDTGTYLRLELADPERRKQVKVNLNTGNVVDAGASVEPRRK